MLASSKPSLDFFRQTKLYFVGTRKSIKGSRKIFKKALLYREASANGESIKLLAAFPGGAQGSY